MRKNICTVLLYACIIYVISSIPLFFWGVVLEILGESQLDPIDTVIAKKEEARGGVYGMLFITCVIVPLVETLSLQHWLIKLLKRFLSSPLSISLLAGVIFGIFHPYSLMYVVSMFLVGTVYAAAYLYVAKRENTKIAFASLAVSHSISNGIAMLSYYIGL